MNVFRKLALILADLANRMKRPGTAITKDTPMICRLPKALNYQQGSALQKHVVVVGEGAGAKIIFISAMLEYLEKQLGKTVVEWSDLAVTTSASSVIFSVLCTDRITAAQFNQILLNGFLKDMFTPKGLSIPRYNREAYVEEFKKVVGDPTYMNESLIPLIMTSFSTCTDGLTHFFKSWEDEDGKMKMTEAACRSFAAPYFFGEMEDDRNQTFWADGGLGIFNLPAMNAYAQARANGWLNPGHHTHFLMLGGGYSQYWLDFNQAKKGGEVRKLFEQGLNFMNFEDGGLARASSTVEQIRLMSFLASTYDPAGIKSAAMTVDCGTWEDMPKDLDKMDNWKACQVYYQHGLEVAKTLDLGLLKRQ